MLDSWYTRDEATRIHKTRETWFGWIGVTYSQDPVYERDSSSRCLFKGPASAYVHPVSDPELELNFAMPPPTMMVILHLLL